MESLADAILELCTENPEGISEAVLESELGEYSVHERASAINILLQKKAIQLFRAGNSLLYKRVDQEEAAKFAGLTPEDMLVYQIIKQASNSGIWLRDLKMKSNLQQPQVFKILKTLVGRNLIKSVTSVASKSKKVYMLYELEPSREVTGGAWFTENEFDSEFIGIIRQQCLQYIVEHGPCSLNDVADAVRRSGISREELRLEEYKQVLSTLVFDNEVDFSISTGSGKDARFPLGTELYRASKSRGLEFAPFTSVPCGVCPVLHECTDNGLISPKTCVYFQEWLSF